MKVKIHNTESEIYLTINIAGENRTFRDDKLELNIKLEKKKNE